MELVTRIELATCGLRYRCTTFVLHQHLIFSFNFARLAVSMCDVALTITHNLRITNALHYQLCYTSTIQYNYTLREDKSQVPAKGKRKI